jgi:hypothetical protein
MQIAGREEPPPAVFKKQGLQGTDPRHQGLDSVSHPRIHGVQISLFASFLPSILLQFYGNISIEKSVDDMVSKRASQVFGLDNKS